jgi:ribonuclease D
LWLVRDEIARELDLAPGRLLNDRIIVALTKVATQKVITAEDVKKLVRNPAQDYLNQWLVAIESAKTLAETELPRSTKREDSIPNPKSWEEIKPTAAVRWDKYRPAANELAAELEISPEVLVSPDLLRRYCWEDDEVKLQAEIEARLIELGSRRWAANLLAEKFASL